MLYRLNLPTNAVSGELCSVINQLVAAEKKVKNMHTYNIYNEIQQTKTRKQRKSIMVPYRHRLRSTRLI